MTRDLYRTTPPDMNEREQRIIMLARNLVCQANSNKRDLRPPALEIAAEFLFRFDLHAVRSIEHMRTLMHMVLGEGGNSPLSQEDGFRWQRHLWENRGTEMVLAINSQGSNVHARGYKHYLNYELGDLLFKAAISNDDKESERIRNLIFVEENQTAKICSELKGFQGRYNLMPNSSWQEYFSPFQLKQTFDNTTKWIIWGEQVPKFVDNPVIFTESRLGKGVTQIITVWAKSTGHWQTNEDGSGIWMKDKHGNKAMSSINLIRTWTIYYLTKRGGGQYTEPSAINVWNQEFEEYSINAPRIFRTQRDTILNIAKNG